MLYSFFYQVSGYLINLLSYLPCSNKKPIQLAYNLFSKRWWKPIGWLMQSAQPKRKHSLFQIRDLAATVMWFYWYGWITPRWENSCLTKTGSTIVTTVPHMDSPAAPRSIRIVPKHQVQFSNHKQSDTPWRYPVYQSDDFKKNSSTKRFQKYWDNISRC
jgi:hypothetical protein